MGSPSHFQVLILSKLLLILLLASATGDYIKTLRHIEILSEVMQKHQLALKKLGEQHKVALNKLELTFKQMMNAQLVQQS